MINGNIVIELRKFGFVNKGAELMLHASLEELKKRFPNACFVMATAKTDAPYIQRARLGLFQRVKFYRWGVDFGRIVNAFPASILNQLGVVTEKQIDVILDGAGFSYSSQWGERSTEELLNTVRGAKSKDKVIILLPQAFGPFETINIKKNMRAVLEDVDLIYARDCVSKSYLENAVGATEKIRYSRDFTNLLSIKTEKWRRLNGRACVVPNCRMIDKCSKKEADLYVELLVNIIFKLRSINEAPFLLVHESAGDRALADIINSRFEGVTIEVIEESDPLEIKAIIGNSGSMFGSRFHGLVSALSSGVPAFGIGWSHKYKELFLDYDFGFGYMPVDISDKELDSRINVLKDGPAMKELKRRLNAKGDGLKIESKNLWDDVESFIKGNVKKGG